MEKLDWERMYLYLFVDLKQTASKHNIVPTKSRFLILQTWFRGKEFTRDNFTLFLSEMKEKGYKANYLNNFVKIGKHVAKLLGTDCLADYTYFKKPRYKYIDYLSPGEIKALAEIHVGYRIHSEEINKRYECLYWFLGTTGCRINEALNLLWTDVFADYVIFRETKNGDERLVPLQHHVRELLGALDRPGETVFGITDDSSVNLDLKRRQVLVGIPLTKRIYCHLFRHSFISECQKKKVPLHYIMKITGHRSVESLSTYSHAMLADLEYALSAHPLWQADMSIGDLTAKLHEFVDQFVDKSHYTNTFEESCDGIVVRLERNDL